MSPTRAAGSRPVAAQLGIGAGAIAAVTAVSFALDPSATAVAFFYLIVIELLALTSRFDVLAVVSLLAVACLNFFFIPPLFTLHVEPLDAVELAAFLVTALVTTRLVTWSRLAGERAAERSRLLGLTHDATYVRDLSGRIVYWSGGAETLYGWTAEQALGRVAHELLHTAFPVALDDLTGELDRTGHWQGELGHTTRDGTRLVVNARWAVERDADGRPVRHLVATNDITARNQVEAALQASEARFRLLVDHATDAFFLQDEHGTVIDVNRQACESLGYTREEMIGSRPRDSARELDRSVDDIVDERMPASGGVVTFETRHRRKDGTEFPVEVRVRQFVSDGRRFRLSLVRDVTERTAAEQALRDSEERYRTLIEVSPQAVWIAAPDGAIGYFNEFMFDYSGFVPEEVLGHAWLENAVRPDHRESVRAAWLQTVASGGDWNIELPLRRADGEYRWHVTRGRPMRDADGNVVRWVGVAFDIHDRRVAEDALQRAREALMHVTRVAAVGEVTGSFAHELNQPLGAIANNANACLTLLPSGRPELADVREALTDIVGDAERAAGIIERVRALVKRATSEQAPVRLADVVADVVKLTAAESSARRVTIRADVPADLPLVLGDRVQLQQVLLNLVVNGMDAMRAVPSDRTLDIRGRRDGGDAVITITDRGTGLPAGQGDRIFEAFYTTKPDGMGLGLAISRSIVEAHGGRLSAETNPGAGATFTMRLPAAGG